MNKGIMDKGINIEENSFGATKPKTSQMPDGGSCRQEQIVIPPTAGYLFTIKEVNELLQEQRKICAEIACVILPSHPHFNGSKNVNTEQILNAKPPQLFIDAIMDKPVV